MQNDKFALYKYVFSGTQQFIQKVNVLAGVVSKCFSSDD